MSVVGLLVIEPMSQTGQKAKYPRRADVFRFGPNNGHRSIGSACPFGATNGLMRRSIALSSFKIEFAGMDRSSLQFSSALRFAARSFRRPPLDVDGC
jgi:hypothetical protein